MPTILHDIFSSDPAFTAVELGTVVEKAPFKPGLITQMVQFREHGITTPDVAIVETNRRHTLVPFSLRSGPRTTYVRQTGGMRKLTIPRIAVDAYVQADELLKAIKPGTNVVASLREIIDDYLRGLTDDVDVTEEYHRAYATMAYLKDTDGTTVYDICNEFGVTRQTEVGLDLTNASPATTLTQKLNQIQEDAETAAGNLVLGPLVMLCSFGLWQDLIANAEINNSFKFDAASEFLRRNLAAGSFEWRNFRFVKYSRTINGTSLIPADKGVVFPMDTPGLFDLPYAPADFITPEMMGGDVIGRPRYVPPITLDPENPNAPQWARVEIRAFGFPYMTRPNLSFMVRKGA